MQIDQESGVQTMKYVTPVTHRMEPDFDLLRARVWERSAMVAWRQRIQEIVLTVIAVVLGSVSGWAVMR
jgi:hypothetical protein